MNSGAEVLLFLGFALGSAHNAGSLCHLGGMLAKQALHDITSWGIVWTAVEYMQA